MEPPTDRLKTYLLVDQSRKNYKLSEKHSVYDTRRIRIEKHEKKIKPIFFHNLIFTIFLVFKSIS
jgi:hypothetical protein